MKVVVASKLEKHNRAGLSFNTTPVEIEVSEEQYSAIVNDEFLMVTLIEDTKSTVTLVEKPKRKVKTV